MTPKQVEAAKVRAKDSLNTAAWALKDLARRSGMTEAQARQHAHDQLLAVATRLLETGV